MPAERNGKKYTQKARYSIINMQALQANTGQSKLNYNNKLSNLKPRCSNDFLHQVSINKYMKSSVNFTKKEPISLQNLILTSLNVIGGSFYRNVTIYW